MREPARSAQERIDVLRGAQCLDEPHGRADSGDRKNGSPRSFVIFALREARMQPCCCVGSSPSCEIYAYRGLPLRPLLAALSLEYGGVNMQMGVEAFANLIKIDQECS